MPIPSQKEDEDKNKFMSRCMSDDTMNIEYPEHKQRHAICVSKAIEGLSSIAAVDFQIKHKSEAGYLYENIKTGEVFTYTRKGVHKKDGTILIYKGRS
jgi:hypothetical protein|tara:strand:- start:110 stop:403 length:294 start_codon:yes stop_codon:yes gene_type:complete